MKKFTVTIIMIWSIMMNAQDNTFKIYDSQLEAVEFNTVLEKAKKSDMVFFGETHNSTVAHKIQLQLAIDLTEFAGERLVIGAEMFERDNQLIIDEYMADFFDDAKFEADARLWPNYRTDYRPLLKWAKENKIRFIATNAPRRYASMVSRDGFNALEKLSDEAKTYIADLPIKFDPQLTCYKTMMIGLKEKIHGNINPENLAKAQALKDATMAMSILQNYKKGDLFYHINGNYHTYNKEGIVWHIRQSEQDTEIFTISVIEADNIRKLPDGYKNKADVIIAIPKRSPRSY
ncbi:MAG: ChaN family lipoprotein [Candidatus Delongbacteria bacterium]